MPLVITINPNSGELLSNISLLSLCNTWYLRRFPSCFCSPGAISFTYWQIPHIVLCSGEEVSSTDICKLVFFFCQCLHMFVLDLYSLTFPHHALWLAHRDQNDLISPLGFTSVKGLQSIFAVNRPGEVIPGYFLKSVSSSVMAFDDAFGGVTLPVRVAHRQGC